FSGCDALRKSTSDLPLLHSFPTRRSSDLARLLLACDPRRSPDRGTLALLGELSRSAMQTRVWLLPVDTEATRLEDWRAALQRLGLTEATLDWLETGHD